LPKMSASTLHTVNRCPIIIEAFLSPGRERANETLCRVHNWPGEQSLGGAFETRAKCAATLRFPAFGS
jgi:hypothetical protein